MAIENIPVMINVDPRDRIDPIGTGEINDDGELVITVKKEEVNKFVTERVGDGHPMEIYLGFGWRR